MACPWHISAEADYSHAKVAEFIFRVYSRIELRAYQNKKRQPKLPFLFVTQA